MRADMNIASFHFSLQTTTRIVSLLCSLYHWVTGCHTGISDGDAGSAEESGPTAKAEECWPVLLLKSQMDQISRVQVTGMKLDTQIQYTFSLRLSYNILRQRTKHELMNIRMPCETRCIIPSATAVHQNPTWNNQRWFFNVLLCHRMFRFTQGLAFKVSHTILQNLPSLSSA